jgi:3'(2'), 5'-bisphosphate nucleotidase
LINIDNLIEVAIESAIKAGIKIMEIYSGEYIEIKEKEDHSPITQADRAAHEIIFQQLKATRIPAISEEGASIAFEERNKWDLYWLIDPLDGTKEFIKRNGEFTVNIALIENQAPLLGVIYLPVTKMLYFASPNGSFKIAYDENKPTTQINSAQRLPLPKKHEGYIVVGSRSHQNEETQTFIQNLHQKNIQFISAGSSLKFCLIAEGSADIYPRMGPTMEWDTAAGHAIAKYAGATITKYPEKTPLTYNKEDLLNPWFVVSRSEI